MVQRIPKICERECSRVCALLNCSLRRNRKCMCPLNAVFALNRFFFSRMVFACFCILGTSLKQSKSLFSQFQLHSGCKEGRRLISSKEGRKLSLKKFSFSTARTKQTHTCPSTHMPINKTSCKTCNRQFCYSVSSYLQKK